MTASHQARIKRLDRLEQLLPRGAAPANCLDGAQLLQILGGAYGQGSLSARRRALQRDLDELVKKERIQAVNPGGKPLRYRRIADDPEDDPRVWHFTLIQIRDLVATRCQSAGSIACGSSCC